MGVLSFIEFSSWVFSGSLFRVGESSFNVEFRCFVHVTAAPRAVRGPRRARLLDRRAPAPRENLRKTIKTRRGRRSAADTRLRELKRGSKRGRASRAERRTAPTSRHRRTATGRTSRPGHNTGHGPSRQVGAGPSARARGGGRGGGGSK